MPEEPGRSPADSDEYDEREGCVEVDPKLLELHEVLEWQNGGPLK